jgi:hypothetical protein
VYSVSLFLARIVSWSSLMKGGTLLLQLRQEKAPGENPWQRVPSFHPSGQVNIFCPLMWQPKSPPSGLKMFTCQT